VHSQVNQPWTRLAPAVPASASIRMGSTSSSNDGVTRVLFICSRNRWRSPTAERIYRGKAGLEVRSAGTSRSAVHPVTVADVTWADVIMLMEDKHKRRLAADFPDAVRFKDLHVLDIPDDYRFMQPELVEELTLTIDPILFPLVTRA